VPLTNQTDPLDALEHALGYTFSNRNLLATAVTNPSYRSDQATASVEDNQRLEFLGDAVFGLLTAQELYTRYPEENEGGLTVRRSHLASGRALAELARRIGLGQYLRLGKGDETTGGRDKDKSLTDAMEAIFGAAWCDGGHPAAQKIYATLRDIQSDEPLDVWAENPKGQLQELAQRKAWPDSPSYEAVSATGPSHAPEYTVRAKVATGHEAVGTGKSKRAAEAEAARALLHRLHDAGLA